MPSTVVASFHYDIANQALRVIFVSGTVYDYFNVPAKVYEAMKAADSKGTFLNEQIKGFYHFKKAGG